MTGKIDELLEYLARDGRQHTLKEMASMFNIPLNVCKDITSFLAKYKFIQVDGFKIVINPKVKEFILTTDKKVVFAPFP